MIFNTARRGGVRLPTLTNPASASDLLAGKQLIDKDGNILTGTMPSVKRAVPSVSISDSGLITTSAKQEAGYVSAGTESNTLQLSVQEAQTITPGTSSKTIYSGRYLTGNQTIAGSANLVPGNIRSGVNIFGVTGNVKPVETWPVSISNGLSFAVTCAFTQADFTTTTREIPSNGSINIEILNYSIFCIYGSGTISMQFTGIRELHRTGTPYESILALCRYGPNTTFGTINLH